MNVVMRILQLISMLLPLVQEVVSALQQAFPKGTGAVKKQVAMGILHEALMADPSVTAGLAPAFVQAIMDRTIEAAVRSIKVPASQQTITLAGAAAAR